MKYGLRVLRIADADVDEQAGYLAGESLEAALRFCDAVPLTYLKIAEHPFVHAVYPHHDERFARIRMCP